MLPHTPTLGMRKILVLDDEPEQRANYVSALAGAGFEVFTAEDGVEALAKLALAPDLVILDLMTPGLDGYDVIKLLRRTAGHETTPVIVASGVATGDWATYLGANRFLRKPFAMSELVQVVKDLVSSEERPS